MRSIFPHSPYPSALSTRSVPPYIVLFAVALAACGGSSSNPSVTPSLLSTTPADVATSVPINSSLTATFNTPMTALTTTTFTLTQGGAAVPGSVTTSVDGTTATFAPSASLSASSVYKATITAGARSVAGVPFAADKSWSFTTGTVADSTRPTVSVTSPAASATGVPLNTRITINFTKPMDAGTINSTTFTVTQGTAAVSGNVTLSPNTAAIFTPGASLNSSTVYTAAVCTRAKQPAAAADLIRLLASAEAAGLRISGGFESV